MANQDFDRLYAQVPVEQKELLSGFRVTHPYQKLDICEGRWRYLACGQGNAALLFIPGAFLAADMWFQSVLALENRYRIIAPDSYTLQGTFGMDAVCLALVQILDTEGIAKTTIIGLSAGGGVAQYFVQEYPDRVEHLVLSHCGILEPDAEAEAQLRRLLAWARLLPVWLIRRLVLKRTAGTPPPTSAWIEFHNAYFQEAGARLTKEIFLRFLQGGAEVRRHFVFATDAIESWPGELLILGSRDDELAVRSLDKLQARFPRARTHLLAEGGHHTFMLFPQAYTSALDAFLSEVMAGTAHDAGDPISGGAT